MLLSTVVLRTHKSCHRALKRHAAHSPPVPSQPQNSFSHPGSPLAFNFESKLSPLKQSTNSTPNDQDATICTGVANTTGGQKSLDGMNNCGNGMPFEQAQHAAWVTFDSENRENKNGTINIKPPTRQSQNVQISKLGKTYNQPHVLWEKSNFDEVSERKEADVCIFMSRPWPQKNSLDRPGGGQTQEPYTPTSKHLTKPYWWDRVHQQPSPHAVPCRNNKTIDKNQFSPSSELEKYPQLNTGATYNQPEFYKALSSEQNVSSRQARVWPKKHKHHKPRNDAHVVSGLTPSPSCTELQAPISQPSVVTKESQSMNASGRQGGLASTSSEISRTEETHRFTSSHKSSSKLPKHRKFSKMFKSSSKHGCSNSRQKDGSQVSPSKHKSTGTRTSQDIVKSSPNANSTGSGPANQTTVFSNLPSSCQRRRMSKNKDIACPAVAKNGLRDDTCSSSEQDILDTSDAKMVKEKTSKIKSLWHSKGKLNEKPHTDLEHGVTVPAKQSHREERRGRRSHGRYVNSPNIILDSKTIQVSHTMRESSAGQKHSIQNKSITCHASPILTTKPLALNQGYSFGSDPCKAPEYGMSSDSVYKGTHFQETLGTGGGQWFESFQGRNQHNTMMPRGGTLGIYPSQV